MKKYLFLFTCSLFFKSAVSQCAMCKAVIENDSSLANGINDGIVYLMIIPYALLVSVGYLVYRHYKKTKDF